MKKKLIKQFTFSNRDEEPVFITLDDNNGNKSSEDFYNLDKDFRPQKPQKKYNSLKIKRSSRLRPQSVYIPSSNNSQSNNNENILSFDKYIKDSTNNSNEKHKKQNKKRPDSTPNISNITKTSSRNPKIQMPAASAITRNDILRNKKKKGGSSIQFNIPSGNTSNDNHNESLESRTSLKNFRSTSLKTLICANPKAFMQLVDQEHNKTEEITTSITTCGASEDVRDTIEQLNRIKQGENPEPKTKEEIFKETYTIIENDININDNNKNKLYIPQVIVELITTEREYLKRMNIVVDLFLNPIRERELLNSFEIISLFSNIEDVVKTSSLLLNDLETCFSLAKNDKTIIPSLSLWIGEIFIKYSPILQPIYSTYCTNQPTIDSSLRQFKTIPRFSAFLRSVYRKPECLKQDITSFLINPLQRLCKYPLLLRILLKETQKHTNDYKKLNDGYTNICECVKQVNIKVKQVENLTKLAEIHLGLSNGYKFRDLIVDPKREFIMNEYMIVNNEIRNVYLFNHLILITQQTPQHLKLNTKNRNTIEHYVLQVLLINFIEIKTSNKSLNESIDIENDTNFELECNGSKYMFQCKDSIQKNKWIKQIKKYLNKTSDEILKDSNQKSRMISVGQVKQGSLNVKKRRSSVFSTILRSESEIRPHNNNIDKLQKTLRNEQLRRKIEEDNTKTYKMLYDDLKEKYDNDIKEYKDQIDEMQIIIDNLQNELSKYKKK